MFDAKAMTKELVTWVADYFQHNAPPQTKAIVGISGGKDSSIVAALCVAALGRELVLGVLMPQGVQSDIDVSIDLCATLGIASVTVNIGTPVAAFYDAITAAGLALNDVATFNTPARARMTVLYAVSAIVGGRVANTSNLSEDWVGYATKFGDSAGDFSPLMSFTVRECKAIGRELGLPSRFIDKVPIDGLCGRTDEENLGFSYEVLDAYIRDGICPDAATQAKIDRLHAQHLHKLQPMPHFRYKHE